MCEEKELLVGYLYDDLADGERAAFETHVRGCFECRAELKGLRDVRADLAAWAPPEPDFGFRVVRGGRDAAATDIRPAVAPPIQSWRAWWTPAAGLAAAAVLVLAAAASLAHLEVHRGPDGITMRTGWGALASASAPIESARGDGGTSPQSGAQDVRLSSTTDTGFVAEIERRLNALEAASSRDSGVRNASTLSARSSDAEMIRRFRDLLAQSEQKQQGELALRLSQVMRDFDAQRVADLTRIQKGLSSIDATVTAEAAARHDLTNIVLMSAKQK